MEKAVYSVDEMAQVMGVSRPVAYALAKSKGFPAVQIGRRIVIPIEAFYNWMNEQAQKSVSA